MNSPTRQQGPVEVGLQTGERYRTKGVMTMPTRTSISRPGRCRSAASREYRPSLLPGFVRVRVPRRAQPALLVPEVAVGANQGGRYVLTVNADNVVEQRRVELGQSFGQMRAIETGLKPDDRVVVAGILDAIPGQKVDPQRQTPKAAAMEPTAGQAGSK